MNRPSRVTSDECVLFNAVDVRDPGVIERGEELRLPLEPCHAAGIAGESLGQNLQRDLAFQLRVPGAVDLAHAANTEEVAHLVRADARARWE
jgi:hypothetical protein